MCPLHGQPPESAALADDAWPFHPAKVGHRGVGYPALLVRKVFDQIRAVEVVLAHVVVVDRVLDKTAGENERVDGGGGSVRLSEERFAVDLAQDAMIGLDDGVGSDHLQVEHGAAGLHCVDHIVQDVHDVLGLHSSE
jgi:hypothetical protein